MSIIPSPKWTLDLRDPRAPLQAVWDAMTDEERREVVESLPSEFPPDEAHPPEGDHHFEAYSEARDILSRWFRERGRRVYVSGNLPVFYPGEHMFSPDVIAVLDVEPHPRPSWIVSHEGKGLDFALEVIVSGSRRKDVKDNVERYAQLGIGEYFVYDFTRRTLNGYRLKDDSYERAVPQGGAFHSAVLELGLRLEEGRLRFLVGNAVLPSQKELVERLTHFVDDAQTRALELEAALEEEQKRREEEQKRREEAERELELVKAELERLKSNR
ncbi:MAG: Uma2 family endonuclease [Polyangiaceae bacterium]|nr:Uma2 family endonuclease [Polyangiaceae bacterium]